MKFFTVAVAALCMSTSAMAATFTDRAAFLAASGTASDHTTGNIPRGTTSRAFSNGLTVSTLGPEMASASSFGASDLGIANAILISGVEHLNFQFDTLRFGFGLDIFESTLAGTINGCGTAVCSDSTFTFTFKNGGAVVGSETFNPINDTVAFFGALYANPFDRVEMRETSGTNDNERFGGFVSTMAPVPVPAALPLLLLGLGAVGFVGRRRNGRA